MNGQAQQEITPKVILITGATDGIGLATARKLAAEGHHLLLHGRNPEKLQDAKNSLSDMLPTAGSPTAGSQTADIETYVADLSDIDQVEALAAAVMADHKKLDVLINNAGVLKTPNTTTADGLDVRFVVNTIAPYLLTQRLLPLLGATARVVNLSSAAQAPVDSEALAGRTQISEHFAAYAQSKLALTMWSRHLAESLGNSGPAIIAVNPGSMLGSKMVKEGFGVDGGDLSIGADVLSRAALADEFESASGKYFDNDAGKFCAPHQDALNHEKCQQVVKVIETILAALNINAGFQY